jgi:predicted DNA-binding transcriptional regulator YafY
MIDKSDKNFRLLEMNDRLSKGESIIKSHILAEFGIPSKTFQRDISSLKQYYSEKSLGELIYDRKQDCYRLTSKADKLTKQEVFAVCKILIESRALSKPEFEDIIGKLLEQCEIADAKAVRELIANERHYYMELQHRKPLVDALWRLAEAVKATRITKIIYTRKDGVSREHLIKPVGIMFSEFYFYLIAYIADDRYSFPTTFRVDRIESAEMTAEHFYVPYAKKFSEAEFRKRVQFMTAGELKTIRFLFKGNPEAVLDRLPTANIEEQTPDGYIIRAEVYGDGVDMWIRSQGEKLTLIN